jgi:hypothetical protein
MQPILWIELPTSALVGAGSLCPSLWTLKARQSEPAATNAPVGRSVH